VVGEFDCIGQHLPNPTGIDQDIPLVIQGGHIQSNGDFLFLGLDLLLYYSRRFPMRKLPPIATNSSCRGNSATPLENSPTNRASIVQQEAPLLLTINVSKRQCGVSNNRARHGASVVLNNDNLDVREQIVLAPRHDGDQHNSNNPVSR
jgi:hypothetical protein